MCAAEARKHKKKVPGGFWVGCVTLPISWKSDPRFKVSRLAAFSISIFIRRSLHCFHWPETTRVQMRVQPFSTFFFLEYLRPVLWQAGGVPEFFSTETFSHCVIWNTEIMTFFFGGVVVFGWGRWVPELSGQNVPHHICAGLTFLHHAAFTDIQEGLHLVSVCFFFPMQWWWQIHVE